jgi:hypothetical protein
MAGLKLLIQDNSQPLLPHADTSMQGPTWDGWPVSQGDLASLPFKVYPSRQQYRKPGQIDEMFEARNGYFLPTPGWGLKELEEGR